MAWGLECLKIQTLNTGPWKKWQRKRSNTSLTGPYWLPGVIVAPPRVSFTLRGWLAQWYPSLCSSVSRSLPPSPSQAQQQTCVPQVCGLWQAIFRSSARDPGCEIARERRGMVHGWDGVTRGAAAAWGLRMPPTLDSHPSVVSVFKWTYVFIHSKKSERFRYSP